MTVSRVFIDANIIFSRTLRDWHLQLGNYGIGFVSIVTSEDALVEAQGKLRKKNPKMSGQEISLIRHKVIESVGELITDYLVVEDSPNGDIHDAHIHAAAVASASHYLVTCDQRFLNINDESILDGLPYEIYHPDDFLMLVNDSHPQLIRDVAISEQTYWRSKPASKGVRQALLDADCPQFARAVELHFRDLSGHRR